MAPVLLELRRRPRCDALFVATAQHREMLDQVCAAFDLRPDVDLDLMRPDQELADVTARVLLGVRNVLRDLSPDAVLVHGDTTTCLASTLAAFYAGVPVGHVEAGLRTHDLAAPWPEEMNRRLTDPLARWCFAPTECAAQDLRAERVRDTAIHVVGNTVVDALELALERNRARPPTIPDLPSGALEGRKLVLVTGHRRESFGPPLRELCSALREVVDRREDAVLVYPVHLNPNVRAPVHELLGGHPRIHLVRPLEYLPFVALLARATVIVTDSGGIQEEAPTLGVPVLVTRAATERPEAIEQGLARLVGTSRAVLVPELLRALSLPRASTPPPPNPYGDGRASQRIADVLLGEL
ncbi:MAG: UDP-N-acetylglucosamine 2-epimerase (non-hydrolyzing) [Planctomycetes bacterium]|nr:UDP-N-acetylglucosamine 2-epimerase (non-hydrolyzing) [Planctomycetota bacterium]